jgi:uncharacterized protein (TIGR03067 family)
MILTKVKVGAAAVVAAGVLLAALVGAFAPPVPAAGRSEPAGEPAAPVVAEAPDPADVRQLQGQWRAVEGERDGRREASYEVRSQRLVLTFREDRLTGQTAEGPWPRFTFEVRAGRTPREIDLTPLDVRGRTRPLPGIYSLEEGRLRLCVPMADDGGKRPTQFKTRAGDGVLLLVLERVPAKEPGREPRRQGAHDTTSDEFGTILYEWKRAERSLHEAYGRAKTADERRQILAGRSRLSGSLAERCVNLTTVYPDTSAALAALCWAVSAAPATEAGKKALALLEAGRMARADLDDLAAALQAVPNSSTGEPELAPLVLDRVKRRLDHPRAARLLAWVCAAFRDEESPREPRAFAEAADLIADRFAGSDEIQHLCEVLGVIRQPRWAAGYEKHLRTILRVNGHSYVRAEALFALAHVVQDSNEARQEEARKLYQRFVKEFTGRAEHDGWDQLIERLVREAQQELDGMLVRAIGEPAPDVEGEDLDGRPMKLADFRGKVVLVSFWATSCDPCMKLVPHERALVKRLKDQPFALVGVNGDTPQDLKKALAKDPLTWRSFKDRRPGKTAITHEWRILAFPTLYLIDHKGVIRKRWIGAPPVEELDREVDRLVGAVPRAR